MHIEPGIVHGAKIVFSYATAAGALGVSGKLLWEAIAEKGMPSVVARSAIATLAVFVFFELLPHFAVGVSEVHFILGSTLLLMLGVGPAAVGLSLGLLAQGLLFAPSDLPQYTVNLTTLLVPLIGIHYLARSVVPAGTAYVDLTYTQALKLSATYQGGIVAWVAFWAIYGAGVGADNLAAVASFGAAYMLVVIIEPIADLAVLATAKAMRSLDGTGLVQARVYHGD